MRALQARRAVALTLGLLVALTAAATRADAHQPPPVPLDDRTFSAMIAMCSVAPEGCQPPPPPPKPKPPRASRSQASRPPSGDVWSRLAYCESGQNGVIRWGIDSRYDGGLQFDPPTWTSVKAEDDPPFAYQATPERQIAAAQRLQARSGWGQWPRCSRRLGLR